MDAGSWCDADLKLGPLVLFGNNVKGQYRHDSRGRDIITEVL